MRERVKNVVRSGIDGLDGLIADLTLRVKKPAPALVIVCFHGLFADARDIAQNRRDPQEAVTIDHFRAVVGILEQYGAVFINERGLAEGLSPDRVYAWITFDDGYKNNDLALPWLAEKRIPATIFPIMRNVTGGAAFWWDAWYRGRQAQGWADQRIAREIREHLPDRAPDIEAWLRSEFGADILTPLGDGDRPYTLAELAARTDGELVTLGNHTVSHAHLGVTPVGEMKKELAEAEEQLARFTRKPSVLALPMGFSRPEVGPAAAECGLDTILDVAGNRNPLPLSTARPQVLSRLVVDGRKPLAPQIRLLLSGPRLKPALKNLVKKMRGQ